MIEGQFSRTALSAAGLRAAHQIADGASLFADPLAGKILGDDLAAQLERAVDPELRPLRIFVALRSRLAEDNALRAIARGVRQVRTPVQPYQVTRYWSTVPFLHGVDEAVKYSAMPLAGNIGQPVGRGQNVLRDELARHVAEDPPAGFEFGLQLLEASRMTSVRATMRARSARAA